MTCNAASFTDKRMGPDSGRGFTVTSIEAERFWRYVSKSDGCWQWTGHRHRNGYGAFNIPRIRTGPFPAHRVAFAITHGRVRSGAVIRHTCDNPPCVNPDHLRSGTQRANMRDALAKGRWVPGFRTRCRHCHVRTEGNVGVCEACATVREERFKHLRHTNLLHPRRLAGLRVLPPPTFSVLAGLVTARRASILARYFGLYDYDHETLDAIGQSLGVSRERVRQLVGHTQDILLNNSLFASFWAGITRRAA